MQQPLSSMLIDEYISIRFHRHIRHTQTRKALRRARGYDTMISRQIHFEEHAMKKLLITACLTLILATSLVLSACTDGTAPEPIKVSTSSPYSAPTLYPLPRWVRQNVCRKIFVLFLQIFARRKIFLPSRSRIYYTIFFAIWGVKHTLHRVTLTLHSL